LPYTANGAHCSLRGLLLAIADAGMVGNINIRTMALNAVMLSLIGSHVWSRSHIYFIPIVSLYDDPNRFYILTNLSVINSLPLTFPYATQILMNVQRYWTLASSVNVSMNEVLTSVAVHQTLSRASTAKNTNAWVSC